MLVNDDHLVTESLSSETFWKSAHINNTINKEYIKPTKPTHFNKKNSKRLNLNYNKSNILKFNEKIKASKKTIRNNR